MDDRNLFVISKEELKNKSAMQYVAECCLAYFESDLQAYNITIEQFFTMQME